jgi:hypothetical protein
VKFSAAGDTANVTGTSALPPLAVDDGDDEAV